MITTTMALISASDNIADAQFYLSQPLKSAQDTRLDFEVNEDILICMLRQDELKNTFATDKS